MAFTLAVGTKVEIASAYAAPVAFTAATNVAETVLSTAGSFTVGDFVEVVSSGWSLLAGRMARVKALSAGVSITLEGIDCSDTSKFPTPTSNAAGQVRKVSTWVQLSQLTSGISSSGGDQQYADITTLEDRTQRQIPTVRSPVALTLPVFFDQSLPWVAAVRSASDGSVATGVKLI